jgi:hypothetical protein
MNNPQTHEHQTKTDTNTTEMTLHPRQQDSNKPDQTTETRGPQHNKWERTKKMEKTKSLTQINFGFWDQSANGKISRNDNKKFEQARSMTNF